MTDRNRWADLPDDELEPPDLKVTVRSAMNDRVTERHFAGLLGQRWRELRRHDPKIPAYLRPITDLLDILADMRSTD